MIHEAKANDKDNSSKKYSTIEDAVAHQKAPTIVFFLLSLSSFEEQRNVWQRKWYKLSNSNEWSVLVEEEDGVKSISIVWKLLAAKSD